MGLEIRVVVVSGRGQLERGLAGYLLGDDNAYALYLVGEIHYMDAYICQIQTIFKTSEFYLK